MATYSIGEQPLQVRALRRDLREWLARLDLDTDAPRTGSPSRTLRRFSWSQADGWRLEFTMQQLRPEDVGRGRPLIRAHMKMGWGHDSVRILGVLDDKANKYGALDAPLVVAVLCNSESGLKMPMSSVLCSVPCSDGSQALSLLVPASCSNRGTGVPAEDGEGRMSRR